MKVLNLQCAHQHSFEGWFASENEFQSQLSRGLVECPVCADKRVRKLPSAPRLNLRGHSNPDSIDQARQMIQSQGLSPRPEGGFSQSAAPAVVGTPTEPDLAQQATFLKALRHVLTHSEDVGARFAEKARQMHYGELEARSIRGQTTIREAAELIDEGIDIMPLPLLPGGHGPLQ